MKTAFEVCGRYWPKEYLDQNKEKLKKIFVLELPEDLIHFNKVDKDKTIVIMKKASVYNSLQILSRGFSHCLQEERSDLKRELLVSCLMLMHPGLLANSQIPFFLKGFSKSAVGDLDSKNTLIAEGHSAEDRHTILQKLEAFLNQSSKLKSISDLALQIFDELYTNALFNAPFQSIPGVKVERTSKIVTSAGKAIELFAASNDEELYLGIIDRYGSMQKQQVTDHLLKCYAMNQVDPDLGSGGAGLGLKMVIENSANFYVYCEPLHKTVIGCALLLEGKKANLMQAKHLHISFYNPRS